MRALLWVSVLLMGLWSGYWFIGKAAVERMAEGFFREAPAQGMVAGHTGLTVQGFPNRFDLTVSGLHLADPQGAINWRAPFVQIFSLSYRPWHVIAAFAPTQQISTAGQDLILESAKLQASVVVAPETALTLERTTLVGTKLGISSSWGWQSSMDELRLATRPDPSRVNTHEIGLEISDLTPDRSLTALLPDLPPQIGQIRLDGFAGLSAPIDRFAAENRPELTALDIREASLQWGALAIFAKGNLAVEAGEADGQIDIRVQGWRQLMPLIAGSGMVKLEVVPTVERMLETLAAQSGNPEVLELPLILSDGQMRLGPLPLGPAPRF